MGTGVRELHVGLQPQGLQACASPHVLSDCLSAGVRQFVADPAGDAASLLSWMTPLYRFCVTETDVSEREAMLEGLVALVDQGELDPRGLLPIVRIEPHPSLCARLVTHFLSACDRDGDDKFEGVRELTHIVTDGSAANPGAVFAGLVLFGDRRITGAARAVRGTLGVAGVREFARARLPGLHAASIEFCLDWLLQLDESGCDSAFAHVASMLTMMAVEDTSGIVVDTNNHVGPFGFKTVPESVTKRFEDYYQEILPVLRHIERTSRHVEPVRNVMEVWQSHADAMTRARANLNVRKVAFGG